MASFITLGNYTQQGITAIKASPDRVDAARKLAETCGAEVKDFYLTMGAQDFVAVIEAPDDEAVARFSLAVGALGNARTTTLKAFTEDTYKKIVQSLP